MPLQTQDTQEPVEAEKKWNYAQLRTQQHANDHLFHSFVRRVICEVNICYHKFSLKKHFSFELEACFKFQQCPTFWRLWATLEEEELSWATIKCITTCNYKKLSLCFK